jgi:glycosyltransferase involved in cell wall biosynthesis
MQKININRVISVLKRLILYITETLNDSAYSLKIAYITDQILPQSATDTEQLVSMCSAMASAGNDVLIVGPKRYLHSNATTGNVATYYNVSPDFKYVPIFGSIPLFRGLVKLTHPLFAMFRKVVRSADVIYTRNIPAVIAALFLSRKPVIFETYRPWPDQKPQFKWFFKWMGNHKGIRGFVLHSTLASDSFERIGVSSTKLFVAHNGYNEDIMQPELSKQEARKNLQLPADKTIVTYSGRVNMKKGLGMLLLLASAYPDVQFVVIGSEKEGEFENEARQFANIKIVGWSLLDKVVPYLYASDVLFIPPTSTPLTVTGNTVLPMKTFLYMASNRVIFGPNNADLREVLENGINAVLVDSDDTQKMLEAFDTLIKNESLQHNLAENAYLKVQKNTWSNRGEAVSHFLQDRIATDSQ